MIELRKARERGHARHGWLESYHTFSFADYYDERHMGFSDLRVINEDRVKPGQGFARHSHRDMEILSYVVRGALEHKDSMGNGSVIRPGDIQRMSAGSGLTHSEYNHSDHDLLHFLQIWILPEKKGLDPSYEQKHFAASARSGQLCLVASRSGRDGSVRIHQDVDAYATLLEDGGRVRGELRPGRSAWAQIVHGEVVLNGHVLREGDGAALRDEAVIDLEASGASEALVFDLP